MDGAVLWQGLPCLAGEKDEGRIKPIVLERKVPLGTSGGVQTLLPASHQKAGGKEGWGRPRLCALLPLPSASCQDCTVPRAPQGWHMSLELLGAPADGSCWGGQNAWCSQETPTARERVQGTEAGQGAVVWAWGHGDSMEWGAAVSSSNRKGWGQGWGSWWSREPQAETADPGLAGELHNLQKCRLGKAAYQGEQQHLPIRIKSSEMLNHCAAIAGMSPTALGDMGLLLPAAGPLLCSGHPPCHVHVSKRWTKEAEFYSKFLFGILLSWQVWSWCRSACSLGGSIPLDILLEQRRGKKLPL